MRQGLNVAEIYSEAERRGGQGAAFDLKTGYDFRSKWHRRKCFERLIQVDPDHSEWNYRRMPMDKAVALVGEGVEHVEFAMKLMEWQIRRGRLALFEHPKGSRAWQEGAVQRVLQLPGVEIVTGDQCQFGLRVREEEELNKKPTNFMTNGRKLKLGKRCTGDHEHQPLLHGRAKAAERYPPGLCQAIVKAASTDKSQMVLVEEDNMEGIDTEELIDGAQAEEERREGMERLLPAAEAEDELEEGREAEESDPLPCGVNRREKQLIKKLHINLGHPSTQDFYRAMKMSRARLEVLSYIKKEFKCDHCEEHQPPRSARPATIPKTYAPNRVVGVDIVFMPAVNPKETKPALNVVDWGTCYQVLEPVEEMSSDAVWMSFVRGWIRTFGMPELIVMDQAESSLEALPKKQLSTVDW